MSLMSKSQALLLNRWRSTMCLLSCLSYTTAIFLLFLLPFCGILPQVASWESPAKTQDHLSLINAHWWCSLEVFLGHFSSYHIILGRHPIPTISISIYNLMTPDLLLYLVLPSWVPALTGLDWKSQEDLQLNMFQTYSHANLKLLFPWCFLSLGMSPSWI